MTFELQKNTKAVVWTIGVHLLLLILFIGYKYSVPAPQIVEDMGMEVNLGTSDNGFGTDQPEDMDDPAASDKAIAAVLQQDADENPDVHTTNEEDAPAVIVPSTPRTTSPARRTVPVQPNTSRTRKPNTTTAVTPSQSNPTPAAVKPRYVYPGSTGRGGNSASQNRTGGNEGIGTGDGDMGVPGGTVGASNYSGTPGGGGTSIGHSISGRSMISRPDPKAEFREGGKVVIRVTVNREGSITDTRVVSAGNATIRALALQKIKSVRFNASNSAPAEQFGNITFNFKTTRK
jgi:TonB family protein